MHPISLFFHCSRQKLLLKSLGRFSFKCEPFQHDVSVERALHCSDLDCARIHVHMLGWGVEWRRQIILSYCRNTRVSIHLNKTCNCYNDRDGYYNLVYHVWWREVPRNKCWAEASLGLIALLVNSELSACYVQWRSTEGCVLPQCESDRISHITYRSTQVLSHFFLSVLKLWP